MSVDEFESIRIVGCDEAGVKKRSGDKQNYVIPFSLSADPPRSWADLFDKSWRVLRKASGAAKVDVYLRKGHLVIETSPDEVKLQFPILKSAVADANTKYQEEAKSKAEKDGKKKIKRREEREADLAAIREAISGLDFS